MINKGENKTQEVQQSWGWFLVSLEHTTVRMHSSQPHTHLFSSTVAWAAGNHAGNSEEQKTRVTQNDMASDTSWPNRKMTGEARIDPGNVNKVRKTRY